MAIVLHRSPPLTWVINTVDGKQPKGEVRDLSYSLQPILKEVKVETRDKHLEAGTEAEAVGECC